MQKKEELRKHKKKVKKKQGFRQKENKEQQNKNKIELCQVPTAIVAEKKGRRNEGVQDPGQEKGWGFRRESGWVRSWGLGRGGGYRRMKKYE